MNLIKIISAAASRHFKSGLCLLVSALLFCSPPARAGLTVQTDTNAILPSTTNTFALFGDITGSFTNGESISSAYVLAKNGDDAFITAGGYFTNATAGASNVMFNLAQTFDFVTWSNTAVTIVISVPAATTNWCYGQTLIQNAAPGYALRNIWNTNRADITGAANKSFLKCYVKDGI